MQVPLCIAKVILHFAHDTGPRRKINELVTHQYDVASRFYHDIIYRGLRVATEQMWLPLPYWHPLRDRALLLFIDLSQVPWVDNDEWGHEDW